MGRSKRSQQQPITFVSAELPATRLPRPLVPTDDVKVKLPDYEPKSDRAAHYNITPMGRVYRDDGKLLRPHPETLKIGLGGGGQSRSLPRLVFRAFGRSTMLYAQSKRVVVTLTQRFIRQGQLVEWPVQVSDEEQAAQQYTYHCFGVRWVGEHKDENDEWTLTLTRSGKPEWWDVWHDPEAPLDEVTGAKRCSVYDVALVPHGELIRFGQHGVLPEHMIYLDDDDVFSL
jgi:hypothetical protein